MGGNRKSDHTPIAPEHRLRRPTWDARGGAVDVQTVPIRRNDAVFEDDLIGVDAGHAEAHDVADAAKLFPSAFQQ
jgi:hypothetical protein